MIELEDRIVKLKIKFNEPRQVKQVGKAPEVGHFSLDKAELDWQKCRENFARNFESSTKGFYYSHLVDQGENIAAFIDKVEDILEYSIDRQLDRTVYAHTNLNFTLWVEPSMFWRESDMRRSLFTIFLRSALCYNPATNNFDEALMSCPYAATTKDAIYRFLFGFTDYTLDGNVILSGIGKGWASQFNGKPTLNVREQLVKPKNTKINCIVGAGSLWG